MNSGNVEQAFVAQSTDGGETWTETWTESAGRPSPGVGLGGDDRHCGCVQVHVVPPECDDLASRRAGRRDEQDVELVRCAGSRGDE
jgi:hypothetical protein